MKKYLFLGTLYAGSLFAYNHPCPQHFQISGDYLYMLPTIDDTYFVIDSPTTTTFPNGERINNNLGFHSGFRVGAEYSLCDPQTEFQAFYTRLGAENTKTVTGDFLWATLGRPDVASSFEDYTGSASSNLNLLYQRVDGGISQRAVNSERLYLYLTPGFEYAYLRLNQNYTYLTDAGVSGTINERSKTWGIGPQMGFEVGYSLYETKDCKSEAGANVNPDRPRHRLSLDSVFSGSLLVSKSRANESNSLDAVTLLDVRDESTWRIIPALHARTGLNYTVSWNKVGLALGAGYEFNTYIRGRTSVVFPDDVADGLASTQYFNFDVQGLYVSAAISF